jgi:hypothetical protein
MMPCSQKTPEKSATAGAELVPERAECTAPLAVNGHHAVNGRDEQRTEHEKCSEVASAAISVSIDPGDENGRCRRRTG